MGLMYIQLCSSLLMASLSSFQLCSVLPVTFLGLLSSVLKQPDLLVSLLYIRKPDHMEVLECLSEGHSVRSHRYFRFLFFCSYEHVRVHSDRLETSEEAEQTSFLKQCPSGDRSQFKPRSFSSPFKFLMDILLFRFVLSNFTDGNTLFIFVFIQSLFLSFSSSIWGLLVPSLKFQFH